jgi:hypothetical protein
VFAAPAADCQAVRQARGVRWKNWGVAWPELHCHGSGTGYSEEYVAISMLKCASAVIMLDSRDHARKICAQVLDASGIQALDVREWDQLAASALEANPFYSRHYVLAGLDTIDRQAGINAVSVRDRTGDLVGLFPFRRRFIAPFPWTVARGAENSQQFSGIPLVAPGSAAFAIDAWLETLKSGSVPRFWALGNVSLEGEFAQTVMKAAGAHGLKTVTVLPYDRPYLARHPEGFAGHCTDVVSKSRQQDIRRNLRRLREMGELSFERAVEPGLVAERLDQFLVMERSGWKGQQGSALLCDPAEGIFARRAFSGADNSALRASIDSLLLDGEPIAMSVNIACGSSAFTPKCAHDERFRKQSPGLVLEYLIVERFYSDDTFSDMDAATTTGGHVVQGLWNGRKRMGRLIVGPADQRTDILSMVWKAAHHGRKRLMAALGGQLRGCQKSLKSRGVLVKFHLTAFCLAGYQQKFLSAMETVQP